MTTFTEMFQQMQKRSKVQKLTINFAWVFCRHFHLCSIRDKIFNKQAASFCLPAVSRIKIVIQLLSINPLKLKSPNFKKHGDPVYPLSESRGFEEVVLYLFDPWPPGPVSFIDLTILPIGDVLLPGTPWWKSLLPLRTLWGANQRNEGDSGTNWSTPEPIWETDYPCSEQDFKVEIKARTWWSGRGLKGDIAKMFGIRWVILFESFWSCY